MRLSEITSAQRKLLEEVTANISSRLEAHFTDLAAGEGMSIGVHLKERGRSVVIEIPEAVLVAAGEDAAARHALQIRIKGRRDRMLFKEPPDSGRKMKVESAIPMDTRFGHGGRGRR